MRRDGVNDGADTDTVTSPRCGYEHRHPAIALAVPGVRARDESLLFCVIHKLATKKYSRVQHKSCLLGILD